MSHSTSSSVSVSSSSRSGLWDDGRQQLLQQHRRGHSLSAKDKSKDEDLALFQDMRMREDSAFLHPSMMEMDEGQGSLTAKFGGLSGYRVSAARKGSTDLLTSETDKNDYDWLLTPPGTPLFPCLDRDLLAASPAQRDSSRWTSKLSRLSSEVQAQVEQAPVAAPPPLSASSSSSSSSSSWRPTPRGSNPSPRRQNAPSTSKSKPVSPTPNAVRPSTPTTRGRPSSSSAAPSSARPSTPTGRARPSTPTRTSTAAVAGMRPSTPTPRSSSSVASFIRPSTPTPTAAVAAATAATRRPSTPNGRPAASLRGTSPLRKPPGRSPQGPACEPPPNLRTSAAERPSSNSRAATIPSSSRPAAAAATGVQDVTLLRRQAGLPILTRSYNAPHHEREMPSFSRRGMSSANEGVAGICRGGAPLEDDKSTTGCAVKKAVMRAGGGSRETSFFGTSISKKSLDTAIRHMDIRRSSPGGFRPLIMPNATPLSSSYSRPAAAAATLVARHHPSQHTCGNNNAAQTGCEERSDNAKQDAVGEEGANSDNLFTANADDLLLELTSGSLEDDLSSYRRTTDAGQELRVLEEDYLTL